MLKSPKMRVVKRIVQRGNSGTGGGVVPAMRKRASFNKKRDTIQRGENGWENNPNEIENDNILPRISMNQMIEISSFKDNPLMAGSPLDLKKV